ncbi:MAG: hypothetical protein V3T72_18685 [Thermoanaerobaculia bacterium]
MRPEHGRTLKARNPPKIVASLARLPAWIGAELLETARASKQVAHQDRDPDAEQGQADPDNGQDHRSGPTPPA